MTYYERFYRNARSNGLNGKSHRDMRLRMAELAQLKHRAAQQLRILPSTKSREFKIVANHICCDQLIWLWASIIDHKWWFREHDVNKWYEQAQSLCVLFCYGFWFVVFNIFYGKYAADDILYVKHLEKSIFPFGNCAWSAPHIILISKRLRYSA